MKRYYALPIFTFALTAATLYSLINCSYITKDELNNLYSQKLQVPLFTGFLTLSGFVLSLTTFIVVKMHEAVYQDIHYLERIAVYKRMDKSYSHTKPLENLTSYLIIAVIISLTSSLAQFTIGNYSNSHIAIFCLSLAACAFGFILTSCFLIRENIKRWIDFMTEKKQEEVKEATKKGED
ncbi:MAG TPA: hypothetical protein VF571_09400 [Pyrinomonadaceae bacterium]|jgi:hypothetical protein